MPLFCEALKHSNLIRLFLDGCNIDDQLLQMLASAVTEGCYIQILDIGWNPYTATGLTQFLKTLIARARNTLLVVLSTNGVTDKHRRLVKKFNQLRKQVHCVLPFFQCELFIGCKDDQWAKEAASMHYLWLNPKNNSRD